jgi:hypothetical protein
LTASHDAFTILSEGQSPATGTDEKGGGSVGKWLRIGLYAFGMLVLLAVVGLYAVYRASQAVPEFYEQALKADPLKQKAASDKMVKSVATMTSDLHREGRWQAVFSEDEINGWLAVDVAQNHRELLPGQISDPRVAIRPDGMTLGFRYRDKDRNTILWFEADAYLIKTNQVGLRIRKARAGLLPLPLDDVLQEVTKATSHLDWEVRWQQTDGEPVAQITIPPLTNKQKKYVQIDTLRLGERQLTLAGTTSGQPPKP